MYANRWRNLIDQYTLVDLDGVATPGSKARSIWYSGGGAWVFFSKKIPCSDFG